MPDDSDEPHRPMKLNPADVDRLVNEHYTNLYRFALSLTRNETEAADLTQQTCFQLASKGGQIRDLSKAKSWLFTTLHREFLSLRRHTGRHTSIEDDDPPNETTEEVEPQAVRRADARLVMEALGRVRETFRVPVALFYLEELTYREIAEILEIPIGTVMSRLSRGKRDLRRELADTLSSDDDIIPIRRASAD